MHKIYDQDHGQRIRKLSAQSSRRILSAFTPLRPGALPRRHSRASHRVSSRFVPSTSRFPLPRHSARLGLRRNSGMADLLVPLGNFKPPAMTSQPITTD
ncbi:hypothetical protein CTRI78_v008020 [Colletotrichum trifolii]|uniref:Uncharacterized protein n=1 Tax=Colletotrichum trifolii TaxID=5466 RepID=A0A4V3HUU4_COLTR|nr:hypothetical protein CTRI78_v008020 [Colletotrichum trifolii]